jgi:hypothetical protein
MKKKNKYESGSYEVFRARLLAEIMEEYFSDNPLLK